MVIIIRMTIAVFIVSLTLFQLSRLENKTEGDKEDEGRLFHGYLFKKLMKRIPDIVKRWRQFKKDFNLGLHSWESRKRFFIFGKNLIFINDFNQDKNRTYYLEQNHLTHLSREEYFQTLGTTNPNIKHGSRRNILKWNQNGAKRVSREIADRDWRKNYVISPIRNQGECGSCYAFSSIAATEAALAIKTGKLQELSEQSVVDCSTKYGNLLCSGGTLESAFKYLTENPVPLSKNYPYVGRNDTCKIKREDNNKTISSYSTVHPYDEEELSYTVSMVGPVAVSIDARYDSFKFYKSGIMDEPKCSTSLINHGVTVVGVVNSPAPYYIVRNSYSAEWGDKGYIHIARYKDNMCGIASAAIYPVV